MKKFFVLLTALFAVLVSSCSYDDSALLGDLNALKNKVENLENRVDQQQVLLNALANQLTIVSVETTADGYVITFSDNSTLTVNHGKDGANGEDGKDGANGKDGAIVAVEWDEDCAIFTLADGTTLVIPLDNGELPDQPADPENPDEPVDPENPEEYSTITLTADKESVEIGDVVTFYVTDQDGNDVTSMSSIYDQELSCLKDGQFTATETGSFEFFATLGAETSNCVVITVLAQRPVLPADEQPASTKFNHRALVIDHAGVNCGWCPAAMDELKELEEDTNWNNHYCEVSCHAGGYASGDPANSQAANALYTFQSSLISGYPCILVNFYTNPEGYAKEKVVTALQNNIKQDGADVGISMAVTGDPNAVYCAASVKAAVGAEYKVAAWLLESNISSPKQAGASKPDHKIYNNALRNMAYTNDVQGESIGTLFTGETKELSFELPITSTKWSFENMSVVVVVSAKDENNRWEVVNSACCPLNESKPFEYL